MKIFKVLFSITIITIISLIYVHQQIELVKLSYAIETKEKKIKEMLDRNESLGYNINNLENPSRLERVLLAKKIDVAYPKKGYVMTTVAKVNAKAGNHDVLRSKSVERRIDFSGIIEFFSPRAEAQTKDR